MKSRTDKKGNIVMKNKKTEKNGLLIVLSCILSALIAMSSLVLINGSYIKVKTNEHEFSTYVPYNERVHMAYEDTNICEITFKDALADVTRLGVIRNQMETAGKYDPNKKIDISRFANRVNTIDSTETGAKYKLDDLIKWGNYGYDFQVVNGTAAQLDAFFYAVQSGDKVVTVDKENTVHMESAIDSYASDGDEDSVQTMYMLVDRYKTADGKTLMECAESREDYENLVKNLCVSADSLFTNYTDYVELLENYGSNATNIQYCFKLTDMDGKLTGYDNLGGKISGMTNDEISREFTSHAKYVCFNPDKLQMAGNVSSIDAVYMKQLLSRYGYSFGDGSRIWVALNEQYPNDDIFLASKLEYNNADRMLIIPAIITVIASSIVLVLLIVLMTIKAGRVQVKDEEGNISTYVETKRLDVMPIELYLILVFAIGWGLVCMVGLTLMDILHTQLIFRDDLLELIIISLEAVVCAGVLLPLYLILVRKIKAKMVWRTSILRAICVKIKDGAIDMYDNGQLITRTWLPYLLFLATNLVLVLIGVGGIVVAFVLDMIVGVSLYKATKTRDTIVDGITEISDGDISHKIDTSSMHGDNLALANAVNSIGDGIRIAVETSMKDEKMKADLITNVSHDIKTPLTSIINFVDLLKREDIQDEKIRGYIDVLDQKSQRLKALTNDLVEASKISSGNISLNIEKINLVELVNQSVAEFDEKFEEKGLKPLISKPEVPAYIMADSRGVYRVVENLYNNIYKYALENTRVYIDTNAIEQKVILTIKNISANPLNVSPEELTERFIRGDVSRRTEGSGLGLSIAKSLTEAMHGTFDIALDGDLFKVILTFDMA